MYFLSNILHCRPFSLFESLYNMYVYTSTWT